MSLTLSRSAPQISVNSKSLLFSDHVDFGEYEISLEDFLAAAEYVLTNTDLKPNDPRPAFVEKIKKLATQPGWTRGGKRLGYVP